MVRSHITISLSGLNGIKTLIEAIVTSNQLLQEGKLKKVYCRHCGKKHLAQVEPLEYYEILCRRVKRRYGIGLLSDLYKGRMLFEDEYTDALKKCWTKYLEYKVAYNG